MFSLMKTGSVMVILIVVCMAQQTFAVDGYKDLKFGESYEEIDSKKKPCDWIKSGWNHEFGLLEATCKDLKFASHRIPAYFAFLDNQLHLVILTIPLSMAKVAVDSLTGKYGKPEFASPTEDFKKVDTTPNSKAIISWKSATIQFKIMRSKSNVVTAEIFYKSDQFLKLYRAKIGKNMKGDI
jgi:hypothetical protein